jgi:hypothetical protein
VDSCYFGYLPWAMVHAPEGARPCHPDAGNAVRISDLLCGCILTWTCVNRRLPAADRLRSLGRHLGEIASMDAGDFREFLRVLALRQAAALTAHEENLLRHHGGRPEYWADELRKHIDARLAAAVEPGYVLPVELTGQPGGRSVLSQVQDLIREYGRLLHWWPEVVEQARTLAAREQLPATRIE